MHALESSFVEKILESPEEQVKLSQQCASVAMAANHVQVYIN